MTKIDSRDYEAGEALTTKEAIKWMADGGFAICENVVGAVYFFDEDKGFGWVGRHGSEGFGVHFSAVCEIMKRWNKAVLIRKPISWEEAVRELLDGKHVWDRCDDEWKRVDELFMLGGGRFSWAKQEFTGAYGPFYLTPPPAVEKPVEVKKERRKVSREDAICAMVRDSENQFAWHENGYKFRMMDGCTLQMELKEKHEERWTEHSARTVEFFYLDPPEAK